ncbi:MAG: TlpA disulfide reductase family protein [Bauldia sp.]
MLDELRVGRRAAVLVAAAAAAGILAGSIAVYVKQSSKGNGETAALAACAGAREAVARVAPLAVGEVAAFRVAEPPHLVGDLAFLAPGGEETGLAGFAGRTVLLNLWATWCVPCRTEMPTLDRLEGELGGDYFAVVAVNVDVRNPDGARAFLDDIAVRRLTFYSDPTTAIFNGLRRRGLAFGLPTTLLIDGKGCLIGVVEGPAAWDSEDAKKLVRAAIG